MIEVGHVVKSYDFEGNKKCYVIGEVIRIGEVVEGCERYKIEVMGQVWDDKRCTDQVPPFVYPPINGTMTTMGRVTNFVERV